MATTCRPGMKKSAAETVLLMRCAAGVPLVQRDPSTSGWRRPPALVRWMAVVCRSDWAAALPAHPTGSTRWTGSGYHVVIASTAAELACSAARWRGAGAPVAEKASSEATLWLTALSRCVYWRCRGETSPSWGHCALPLARHLHCVEAGARGVAVEPHPRVSGRGLPLLRC